MPNINPNDVVLKSEIINSIDIGDESTTIASKIAIRLKELIDQLEQTKINIDSIVDTLDSTDPNSPLSANMGKTLNDTKIGIDSIIDNLESTSSQNPLSANMGRELKNLTDGLDTSLREYIDEINSSLISLIALKSNISDIVDNLNGEDIVDAPLSANQGFILNGLIGELSTLITTIQTILPTKINYSDIKNSPEDTGTDKVASASLSNTLYGMIQDNVRDISGKANKVEILGNTILLKNIEQDVLDGSVLTFDNTLTPDVGEAIIEGNSFGTYSYVREGGKELTTRKLIVHVSEKDIDPEDGWLIDPTGDEVKENGIYYILYEVIYQEMYETIHQYTILDTFYEDGWKKNTFTFPSDFGYNTMPNENFTSNIFLSDSSKIQQPSEFVDLIDTLTFRRMYKNEELINAITNNFTANVADYKPLALYAGDLINYDGEKVPELSGTTRIYSIDHSFYIRIKSDGLTEIIFEDEIIYRFGRKSYTYECIGTSIFDYTSIEAEYESDIAKIAESGMLTLVAPSRVIRSVDIITAISDTVNRTERTFQLKPWKNYQSVDYYQGNTGICPKERCVWFMLNPKYSDLPENTTTSLLLNYVEDEIYYHIAYTNKGIFYKKRETLTQQYPWTNYTLDRIKLFESLISDNATDRNKLPSTSDVAQMISTETSFRAVLSYDKTTQNYNVITSGDQTEYSVYALNSEYNIIHKYVFELNEDPEYSWAVIPDSDNPFIVLIDSRDDLEDGDPYDFDISKWKWSLGVGEAIGFTNDQLDALNSGITESKVSSYNNHISNQNNPHSVTATQIGLGNVNNTADTDKPISSATQTALNTKLGKDENAVSATKLQTGRTIDSYINNAISSTTVPTFDGTGNIVLNNGVTTTAGNTGTGMDPLPAGTNSVRTILQRLIDNISSLFTGFFYKRYTSHHTKTIEQSRITGDITVISDVFNSAELNAHYGTTTNQSYILTITFTTDSTVNKYLYLYGLRYRFAHVTITIPSTVTFTNFTISECEFRSLTINTQGPLTGAVNIIGNTLTGNLSYTNTGVTTGAVNISNNTIPMGSLSFSNNTGGSVGGNLTIAYNHVYSTITATNNTTITGGTYIQHNHSINGAFSYTTAANSQNVGAVTVSYNTIVAGNLTINHRGHIGTTGNTALSVNNNTLNGGSILNLMNTGGNYNARPALTTEGSISGTIAMNNNNVNGMIGLTMGQGFTLGIWNPDTFTFSNGTIGMSNNIANGEVSIRVYDSTNLTMNGPKLAGITQNYNRTTGAVLIQIYSGSFIGSQPCVWGGLTQNYNTADGAVQILANNVDSTNYTANAFYSGTVSGTTSNTITFTTALPDGIIEVLKDHAAIYNTSSSNAKIATGVWTVSTDKKTITGTITTLPEVGNVLNITTGNGGKTLYLSATAGSINERLLLDMDYLNAVVQHFPDSIYPVGINASYRMVSWNKTTGVYKASLAYTGDAAYNVTYSLFLSQPAKFYTGSWNYPIAATTKGSTKFIGTGNSSAYRFFDSLMFHDENTVFNSSTLWPSDPYRKLDGVKMTWNTTIMNMESPLFATEEDGAAMNVVLRNSPYTTFTQTGNNAKGNIQLQFGGDVYISPVFGLQAITQTNNTGEGAVFIQLTGRSDSDSIATSAVVIGGTINQTGNVSLTGEVYLSLTSQKGLRIHEDGTILSSFNIDALNTNYNTAGSNIRWTLSAYSAIRNTCSLSYNRANQSIFINGSSNNTTNAGQINQQLTMQYNAAPHIYLTNLYIKQIAQSQSGIAPINANNSYVIAIMYCNGYTYFGAGMNIDVILDTATNAYPIYINNCDNFELSNTPSIINAANTYKLWFDKCKVNIMTYPGGAVNGRLYKTSNPCFINLLSTLAYTATNWWNASNANTLDPNTILIHQKEIK